MKGSATILLMLLLLVQTFSKGIWELNYQLNKAYLTENLCVNKSRPQLHCNGKCQLAKKLAEEENNSKTSGTASSKSNTIDVFFKQDIEAPVLAPADGLQKHYAVYTLKPCHSTTNAVFHPPLV